MIKIIKGYEVEINRKKVKNINLRVDKKGKISLSVPYFISSSAAESFFISKINWVKKVLLKNSEEIKINDFSEEEKLWIFGEEKIIKYGNETKIDGEKFFINKKAAKQEEAIRYLKGLLEEKIKFYGVKIGLISGLVPSGFKIRFTTSRWGSCNPKTKKLSFSFYLVSFPENCIEFLVAHELCHLKIPNHGDAFKKLLSAICPAWKSADRFLKTNGEKMRLHL